MSSRIKVTLRRESDSNKALVDLTGTRGESESGRFELPWLDDKEWQAVFLSLELQEKAPKTWPLGDVRKKAQELGLFLQDRPSGDRFKIIGQTLYEAVFCSEENRGSKGIRSLLDISLRLLHAEGEIPVVEFHIPDEGSILQSYPWELLHNGKRFLFDGYHAFPVRHVDFEEPITQLELTGVLSVLYVAPRPNMSSHEGYANLPVRERLHLEHLNRYYPDHLALESLPANTLDALQKCLIEPKKPVHIVHIDTHGDFRDRGCLAFETADGGVDWINGDDLGKRLHRRGVQVVVLSACRSGLVGGKSTFNSVAGALVKQRIPAVVAMQFSIEVKQAEKFVEFFYEALMHGLPLTKAVAEGRIALKDSWYRPVLYLRTDVSNYQGKIFETKSPLGPPKKLGPREKWMVQLGLEPDPFRYTDGGADPFLQKYFYCGMRHFYDIQSDVSKPGTIFVFGPPGSGKSSLRNVISQLCAEDNIFPIVYQDFGPLVCSKEGEEVQVEDHVTQILKTALRTLADLAKESDKKDRSSPEIKKNKIIRNQLWLYVSKYEDDPLRKQVLKNLLKPTPKAKGTLPTDARKRLGRFCRYVTKLFGYQFVYILVDPDNDIDPDEKIAWQVLEPLLSTRRLLDLSEDKVAFKFFLNQKFQRRALKIPWIEQEQSKRVYRLEWPDEELRALLQKRLVQCSGGRYNSLGELSEVDNLDDRVIRLSTGSPRELIVICDRLFSEHCRKWLPDDEETLLITDQEVDEVLEPLEERSPESEMERLIAQGESERVEFKSTMRFNIHTHNKDTEMEREIAGTLCAFMNTEGGTLIIGVDDDGTALGLDNDFSTLGRNKNEDGFQRAFANIVKNLLDPSVLQRYYRARFEQYQGEFIYIVKIEKSEEPVFCLFNGGREFYIRELPTTRKLDVKETMNYCSAHFK